MTSRLEELIAELCPNGVEYKKVKDTYLHIKGTPITASKMKEIASEDGEVRIFAGGKTVINAHESDIPRANITRVPAVLVQSRGVIDAVYYDKPFTFKNEMWAYTSNNLISVKFLYYLLKNNIQYFRDAASGMGSLPQISLHVTEDFEIPVPPLEVQSEIVRILDTFTELTARKKQYEYYRDTLLTFNDNNPLHSLISRYCPNGVEYKKIGDIASVDRGGSLQKKDFCEHGIPCIHYGQIYTKYGLFASKSYTFIDSECASKQRFAHKNDIVMAVTSENIEDVCKCVAWFGEEDVAVSGHSAIIRHNQNAKYLVYYFHSSMFFLQKKKLAHGTKVIEVTPSDLLDVKIPVPPLEVQRQIVQILDRFDALCNDLTQGLPAEIEARRKQYEYYRDQLLTFKRA